mgnify:CR=1 FL=1
MNINDIFLKRKKRWGTINRLRDSEEQADGSLTPSRRIALISDDKSFRELYAQVKTGNPNSFPGYEKKVEANRLKTGQQDAVVTGTCRIGGVKTAVAVMDKRFLMGSMGKVVGEKLTRAFEKATQLKLPVIVFTCSGGARMQEGIISLMQMAKTSAAIKKHDEAGLCIQWCLLTRQPAAYGKLCNAWRCHSCGTGGSYWVRRTACNKTDNRTGTS